MPKIKITHGETLISKYTIMTLLKYKREISHNNHPLVINYDDSYKDKSIIINKRGVKSHPLITSRRSSASDYNKNIQIIIFYLLI